MATIYDVASRAGVSPGTVSKVLSNQRYISTETRERVMKAVSELAFTPNATARNLSRRRTQVIGLIIPYTADYLFADPFLLEFIRGLDDFAESQNYHLLLCTTKASAKPEALAARLPQRGAVDGAVVLETAASATLAPLLERQGYPWLNLGYPIDARQGARNVIHANDFGGAYEMTRYLQELGHRRIAVISGPQHWMGALDARLAGYRTACHEAGQDTQESLIAYGDFTPESGYRAASELLQQNPELTAIFALNDQMALGPRRRLNELGRRVPEDISLAGFDDIEYAAMADPPLTTVRQPGFKMGLTAGEMLGKLMDEELAYFESVVLPTELVKRASTAPAYGAKPA